MLFKSDEVENPARRPDFMGGAFLSGMAGVHGDSTCSPDDSGAVLLTTRARDSG